MDMKKLAPWNWFKKEEEEAVKTVPIKHCGHKIRTIPYNIR